MLFDIALDTQTHDITFSEGGELLSIEGAPLVAQKVDIRLQTQEGEWLYDLAMGIDYFGRVLVKNPNLRVIRSLFVVEINAVEQVVSIKPPMTLVVVDRDLTVDFIAETTEGLIAGGI